MEKVLLLKETPQIREILNTSYESLLAALRVKNPQAQSLIDDDEYSQLHDMLALLRMGQIKIRWLSDAEDAGRWLALSISETE